MTRLQEIGRAFVFSVLVIPVFGNCFFAPTPKNVRIAGWSVPTIRGSILSAKSLADIHLHYDGMFRRMALIESRIMDSFRHEWEQVLITLRAVHDKAVADWAALKVDRELAKSLGLDWPTLEHAVIAMNYRSI